MQNLNTSLKGWRGVIVFIFPYFLITGIFQIIGFSIAGIDIIDLIREKDYQESSSQILIIVMSNLIGTLVVIWFFVRIVYKESFKNLGFSIKDRLPDFRAGLLLGFFIIGTGFYLLYATDEIQISNFEFNSYDLINLFLICFFISFTEETLCRGFVLGNFMISFNNYTALILTSILFSLLHSLNPNIDIISFLNIFLAGLVLGYSYIFTNNLWFALSLHFSWNFFQSLFGFKVSGLELYSLVTLSTSENNFLNGGDFGFEGSILCLVFLSLTLIGLFFYHRKTNNPNGAIESLRVPDGSPSKEYYVEKEISESSRVHHTLKS
ncbi:MAG: type II CAAX endopeptidase family protein [Balneolaceae bacterium]